VRVVAVEDSTTVLAIGGVRGEPFKVSPWEFAFAGVPPYDAKRYEEAKALLVEGSSCTRAIPACSTTSPAWRRYSKRRTPRSST
jgi:hypothetical protein